MAVWKKQIKGVAPLLEALADARDEEEFRAARDAVVARLKREPEFDDESTGFTDEYADIVTNLSIAENEHEFDLDLQDLYDWADDNRVWIDPSE